MSPPYRPAGMHPGLSISVITRSETMRRIISHIDTISASDSSVLLIGETGVGKELFAEYIHRASARSGRPFVKSDLRRSPRNSSKANCSGTTRGDIRAHRRKRRGLFELADTGSIFLDDIGLRDLIEPAALTGTLPETHLVTISVSSLSNMETEPSPPRPRPASRGGSCRQGGPRRIALLILAPRLPRWYL